MPEHAEGGARPSIPFDYLSVADELHSGRIKVSGEVFDAEYRATGADLAAEFAALLADANIAQEPAAPDERLLPIDPESIAAELGLSPKVKVVQGGADALIGMIGLGVARPGQLALITGSSHLQFGVTETPIHAPGVWGAYPDIVYPGRWIVEGGQTSTGSIINWLKRLTGGTLDLGDLLLGDGRAGRSAAHGPCARSSGMGRHHNRVADSGDGPGYREDQAVSEDPEGSDGNDPDDDPDHRKERPEPVAPKVPRRKREEDHTSLPSTIWIRRRA